MKIENNKLNAKILDLTLCLEKFTKGQKNLNLLLGSQRCIYGCAGIGYNPLKKQKLYKNIFVKESYPTILKILCTFCNTEGHTLYSCHIKKCVKNELKTMWVPKKIKTNIQ